MSSGQNNTFDPITLIEPFVEKKGGLMPALHTLQEHFGYISKESIAELATAVSYTHLTLPTILRV